MNPIPLTDPQGRVYAYACNHCHHVAAGSSVLYLPETPGPIDVLVEASLREAEWCCVCRGCNDPCGDFECASCKWWRAFSAVWWTVGNTAPNQWGTGPIQCEICHGALTDFCRKTPKCIGCDDEHGSNPDGRCRDCHLEALFSEAD